METDEEFTARIRELKANAARWKYVQQHWSTANFTFNKDGTAKTLTATFRTDKSRPVPADCPIESFIDQAIREEKPK